MALPEPRHGIMNCKKFGKGLRDARKREGFDSVDELSVHLEEYGVYISPRSLRRYEQGTHTPSCERLAALILALPRDRGAFYIESVDRTPSRWSALSYLRYLN